MSKSSLNKHRFKIDVLNEEHKSRNLKSKDKIVRLISSYQMQGKPFSLTNHEITPYEFYLRTNMKNNTLYKREQ